MDPFERIRLEIVDTQSVRAHEVADPSRERRILARLEEDRMLRDPLLVGAVPGIDGYVLLDGTNRKRALQEMDLPWVMVQVLDYGDEHAVSLRTWCHAAAVPTGEILDAATEIREASISSLATLGVWDALHDRDTLAVLVNRDQQFALKRQPGSTASRSEQLLALVNLYEDRMTRVDCPAGEIEERVQNLESETHRPMTLIAFPQFSRSQVVTMALRGALIPAGITRHVIRTGRALRVNLPLELLSRDYSLEVAAEKMGEHVHGLHPRMYREPTILYDS